MIGRTFGRLTVLEFAGVVSARRMWKVRCICGTERVVAGGNLRSGGSQSCGCLKNELAAARLYKGYDTRSSEYKSWSHLRDRCNNPRNRDYLDYGGRGISYPKEWDDFGQFLADVGPKPWPGAEIERVKNDESYSKSNCRWATRKEQNRNKRNTLWVLLNGKKMSLAEAVEITGTNYDTIRSRIVRGHVIGHGITLPKKDYNK
jgi:hypothetical protein